MGTSDGFDKTKNKEIFLETMRKSGTITEDQVVQLYKDEFNANNHV